MHKEMRKWLVTAVAMLLAGCVFAGGKKGESQVYFAHDAAPAIRIHNTGSEPVAIVIAGDDSAANTIQFGTDDTQTLDLSGANDTIAELAVLLEAATNSTGTATPLEVDQLGCAATTESIDGELTVETVTIQAGRWGALHWDTSDTTHYRVPIPRGQDGNKRGTVRAKSVYGSAGGTGDITIIGYLNRVEVYRKVIESPIYNWSAAGTTETWAEDDATMGQIDVPLDIIVGTDECFLISVERATTGTTGGIGLRVEEQ